jgi:hypothetical protein
VRYLEAQRRADMHFGNGRAVRNLFGEMKMLLARRVMATSDGSNAPALDKQTLVTFEIEDVPSLRDSAGYLDLLPLFRKDKPGSSSEDSLVDDPSLSIED